MYKVFVNEKKLSFTQTPDQVKKIIPFEGISSLEIAIDTLENTSTPEINVFTADLDEMWRLFSGMFRIIEAAGGIVCNQYGKILFIKRLGKWDLPKGKIEKGESLEQAALREVEEETGLKEMKIREFLNTTYHIYTERNGDKILKTTHWFIMDYNGNETPKPQVEEGIIQVDWKDQADIEKNVLGKTFRNIELMLSEYQKLTSKQ